MKNIKKKIKCIITSVSFLSIGITYADKPIDTTRQRAFEGKFFSKFLPQNAYIPVQLGAYFSSHAQKSQSIGINSLIGDYYSYDPHQSSTQNWLVGLGYYVDGMETDQYKLIYGLNAFYLAKTTIRGTITQEQLFTNLSYGYSVTNYPIYFAAKGLIKDIFKNNDNFNITADVGIGPNIIQTSNYYERSLDNGITIPDNIFSGQTNASFSATAGLGLRFNNILKQTPLECGYRFFYLGAGEFHKLNNQVINTLKTGNNYANTVMCSITL